MDLYVGVVTTATGISLVGVAYGVVTGFVEHWVWDHYHSLDRQQDLCVYEFVCLFACLFICLFVCLFICLFVCLFVCVVDLKQVGSHRIPFLCGVPTVPGAQKTQTHFTIGIEIRVEPKQCV